MKVGGAWVYFNLLCTYNDMLCGTQVAGEGSLPHISSTFMDQENNNRV